MVVMSEALATFSSTSHIESPAARISTESVGSNAKERRAARRAAAAAAAAEEEEITPAGSSITLKIESSPAATFAITTPVMNAKERRAARRKAEQALSGDGSGGGTPANPSTAETPAPAPAPAADLSSMTAKERRKAKRAAERMPSITITIPSSLTPTAVSTSEEAGAGAGAGAGSTAKERRAAKRAAAREVREGTGSSGSRMATAPVDCGQDANTATTAKDRRLLRRQEERQKREREEGGGTGTGRAGAGGSAGHPAAKRSKRAQTPHIVFVGQLAFSTTAQALEDHLRKRGGVEGRISVRLLTMKGTNPPRSKGMAFVEVEDAETAYQCLGLHHSRLDGRLLNVERSSGGGKGAKGARIKETRDEQKEFMKSVVQRVLQEFIDAGRLGKNELDDVAKGVLEKMEAKVMERAVKDYCDKPDRLELQNPSAWFTHHAHELCFRADPKDLEAGARDWLNDEKIKAAGRDRDRQKAAKKGRGGGGGTRLGKGGGRGDANASDRGGRGVGGGGSGGRGGGGGGRKHSRERETVEVAGQSTGAPSKEMNGSTDPESTLSSSAGNTGTGRFSGSNDAAEHRGGGDGGYSEQYELKDRGKSDLMSIFPSLRGRGGGGGGGRGGSMGGRGGGGRGFRQGVKNFA